MPTTYTIRIANTGETFSPGQQNGPLWEKALEAGHRTTYRVCLCLADRALGIACDEALVQPMRKGLTEELMGSYVRM
jgi:hypothetical protein